MLGAANANAVMRTMILEQTRQRKTCPMTITTDASWGFRLMPERDLGFRNPEDLFRRRMKSDTNGASEPARDAERRERAPVTHQAGYRSALRALARLRRSGAGMRLLPASVGR